MGEFASLVLELIRHGPNILLYPGAYEPRPRDIELPSAYNLPYEDLTLTTSDRVKIRAYLLAQPDFKRKYRKSSKSDTSEDGRFPTVLMFHGNMDNIGHTLPLAKKLYREVGCNVLSLSPRGYGLSEGHPSAKGLRRDADAALNYILSDLRLCNTQIYLYGQSLGASIAIDLASRRPHEITGLIIENTFTSLRKLIPEVMPVFSFVAPFFRQWNSLKRIRTIPESMAILLLSGSRDEVISPEHMKALHDAASPPGSERAGQIVSFPTGRHNDTWARPGYWDAFADFIDGVPYKSEELS